MTARDSVTVRPSAGGGARAAAPAQVRSRLRLLWRLLWVCAALSSACSTGGLDVVDLAPGDLDRALVAHWSFDEIAGNTLADRSGHGHDGTITGGAPISGQFNDAFRFDGSGSGGVRVPLFPQPGGSWSVAAWVRPPTGDFGTTYRTLVSTEIVFQGGWELNARLSPPSADAPAGPIYQFAYWIGPDESTYVYVDCTCVDVNTWSHLAAVVDREVGKLSLYRNGVLQGELLAPANDPLYDIHVGDPTLYMARWAPDETRNFSGDLDDVVIYGRALAPREIAVLARQALH